MRLPIVSTDHVLGREPLSRAWVRGLEMVAGSADVLYQRESYQRVYCEIARGVPSLDMAFGFSAEVTPAALADLLKSDEAGLPCRIVPPIGWSDQQVGDVISGLGYQARTVKFWSLTKARLYLDVSPTSEYQVLPARSVYKDVEVIAASRFADLGGLSANRHAIAARIALDEPRLDAFVFRKAGQLAGMFSVLTVNTTGLIVDLYGVHDAGPGLHHALLWNALDLCARSQHVSVSAVLEGPASEDTLWLDAGFVPVPGVTVWDNPA